MDSIPDTGYHDRLTKLTESLAIGRVATTLPFLSRDSTVQCVRLFADGNRDKRIRNLVDELDLIADRLPKLDECICAYVDAVPLTAYDDVTADGDRFLEWLDGESNLSAEDCDVIACQRARFEVENQARANRSAHVLFQDLRSVSDRAARSPGPAGLVQVHLNPIRSFATFHTMELLDDNEPLSLPVPVAFFPLGCEIHSALLEEDGMSAVTVLGQRAPCTLDELWQPGDEVDSTELVRVLNDLADVGLVAFG